MANITLKVNSAKETLETVKINTAGNQAVRIQAQAKANYELTDDATGFGPENIMTKRVGNDLLVAFEGSDIENPDLIIEGYYDQDNTNLLIGLHENGNFYPYVPESGQVADAVTQLAEEVAAGQALGGEIVTTPLWVFNPLWLLGAAALVGGIAAAAGGSGGGSSNPDTTADKPVLTAKNDGSVTVKPGADNTKVEVKYTDEDGVEHTSTLTKDKNGNWTSDDPNLVKNQDGTFTIPADKVKDGSDVNAKGIDDKGNEAPADKATAGDHHIPGDSNNDGKVDGDDDSTNNVELPNGQKVPRNTDGAPNVVFGEDTNGDGKLNKQELGSKDADDKTPAYITIPDNTEVGDTVKVTITTPDGTDTKEIPVTAENLKDGFITVDVPVTKDGDITVTAKVTDPAGQSSNEGSKTVSVDTKIPGDSNGDGKVDDNDDSGKEVELPNGIKVPANENGAPNVVFGEDGNLDGKLNKDELGSKDPANTTPVYITIPEGTDAGDTVKVTVTTPEGPKTQDIPVTAEMLDKGFVTVDVPVKQDGEIKVTAKVEDPAGNTSAEGSSSATVDTTPSGVDNHDGKGVVTAPAETNEGTDLVTTVKLNNGNGNDKLPFKQPEGTEEGQLGKDDFDKPTFSNGVTQNPDGTLNVPVGVREFTITTPVKADTTTEGVEKGKFNVGGVDGNEVTVNDTSKTGDTNKPTAVKDPDHQGGVIVTPGEGNDKLVVEFKDENDQPQKVTVTKDQDGNWTTTDNVPGVTVDPTTGKVTITPDAVKDDSDVKATGSEGSKNPAETTVHTDVDGDVPAADNPDVVAKDDGGVVVTPGADNTELKVTFTDEDKNPQEVTIVKGQDDKWVPKEGTTVPNGVIVKPDGTITIDPEAVKDGSPVKAEGKNDNPNAPVGTDEENAKDDTTPATVAQGGVTSAPAEVNETGDNNKVTTTVKLTNNNGATDLPIDIVGTGDKPASGDDFEAPVVKYTDPESKEEKTVPVVDGKVSIPKGVSEFTVEHTAKDDKVTEGDETAKVTVGGVEGNEVTVNDTSTTPNVPPANNPDVVAEDNGGVVVTPGADNTELKVIFTDEDGHKQTVIAKKDENGDWKAEGDTPEGVIVGKDGTITIDPEAVQDNTPVKAEGKNSNPDAPAGKDEDTAKPDNIPAGVDNTGNQGVVTAPATTDEGTDLVTTVKLTNNNGNEKLPFTQPNGTEAGQLGKDDLGEPTFSNGVTKNPDGTLKVPAGVKEFTITTPVKADNLTEGEEKGKFNVGGVDGNEVTVNDTSVKEADKPTVTPSETDGSVTVTPGADNTKLTVEVPNEQGGKDTITFEKDGDTWKPAAGTTPPTGVTIDPKTGVVTIPQDNVEDGATVTATGTNPAEKTATATGMAGTDTKDAAVDNSDPNNPGVVTTSPTDEGKEIVTTVKLTNNNGVDNLAVAVEGTGAKPATPAEDLAATKTFVGYDKDGKVVENGVTANSDGSVNVKPGVVSFTITQQAVEDKKTEGDETVTYTVGGVKGNEATITDTSKDPVPSVINKQSIKLEDNLTDETLNAVDFYPNKDAAPYVGEIASANGEDFNTALSRATGLTNDTTPTFKFELDKPLEANQTVEVTRYTIVNGNRAIAEKVDATSTDKQKFSLTDNLEQTYQTDYEYEIAVKTNGEVTDKVSHKFRLDSLVESLEVTKAQFDDKSLTAQIELQARGNSDVGGTLVATYNGQTFTVKDNDNSGHYALGLQNFDRKDPRGLHISFVDAAGNVTEQKLNFIRNLFSDYNLENGPDTTVSGGAFDNGGYDDSARIAAPQASAPANSGKAVAPTNGNDSLIIGTEKFGGFNNFGNGSLSDQNDGKSTLIDTGAGDDFIQVRGVFQGMEGRGVIHMGDGNDKIQFDKALLGTIADPTLDLDLGEGDNLMVVKEYVGATITSTITAGSGNDGIVIGTNLDGTKNINLGDGDNYIKIGGYIASSGTTKHSDIRTGAGNDTLTVGSNINDDINIDLGAGNNYVEVGNELINGNIITGDGNDHFKIVSGMVGSSTIAAGNGDNQIEIGGNMSGNSITTGSGDDHIKIGKTFANGSVTTGAGDDQIEIGGNLNHGTIMTDDGNDTVLIKGGLSHGGLLGENTESIRVLTGNGNDDVTIEGQAVRGLVDLGAGDDTLTLSNTYYDSNSKQLQFNGGEGNDTLKLVAGDETYTMRTIKNFETIDMTVGTKQVLEIGISHIMEGDSVNKLFVKGGVEDIVNLGKGNSTTENLADTLNGDSTIWVKTQNGVNVEGTTYDVYTVHGTNELVYIQQGVQVL
ncbi:hypothetical protein ACOR62_03080 [Neisseria lisongii]|uniref:Calcium-binding protein n=1 Tax=Neisseria lisongii TaxID=2912188 RepID=A0AAW5AGZ0_9NEIS|nr:calcium-binding protein [Neisseria lisongii]MCF7529362.1 calcium-binding protein [Neisseria lisongii]